METKITAFYFGGPGLLCCVCVSKYKRGRKQSLCPKWSGTDWCMLSSCWRRVVLLFHDILDWFSSGPCEFLKDATEWVSECFPWYQVPEARWCYIPALTRCCCSMKLVIGAQGHVAVLEHVNPAGVAWLSCWGGRTMSCMCCFGSSPQSVILLAWAWTWYLRELLGEAWMWSGSKITIICCRCSWFQCLNLLLESFLFIWVKKYLRCYRRGFLL